MAKKKKRRSTRKRTWEQDVVKGTTDITKFAVEGLVGVSLINTVSANLKNVAKK